MPTKLKTQSILRAIGGKVDSSRGAPMGRTAYFERTTPLVRLRLFRVPLDTGGYDPGGAYWGTGGPLYCCTDGDGIRFFFRLRSGEEKREVALQTLEVHGIPRVAVTFARA